VAYIGEGDWFNPFTEQLEIVEGVWCECYECKSDVHNQHEVDVFYTKAEFRVHQNERQKSYNEYTIRKQADTLRAHTKETEALEEHGRSSSVTTRFDLHTGQLSSDDDRLLGTVRWETLWRASIE
jgi:hypothetical protein